MPKLKALMDEVSAGFIHNKSLKQTKGDGHDNRKTSTELERGKIRETFHNPQN